MRTHSFSRAIVWIGICVPALAGTVPGFTAKQVVARPDRDLFFPRPDMALISRSQENEGTRGIGGRAREGDQPVGLGFQNTLHMYEGLGRWISLGYETVSGKDLSDLAAFPIQDRQVAVEDPSLLEKVVFEINNGHPAEALKLSATLAAKNPGHPGILTAHGLALLGCGEFLKAQALFEQAVKLDPGNPDAHLGLGELASGRLRLDEASKHLEVAVDSSYFRLRALQSYAKCLHDLGRHAATHSSRSGVPFHYSQIKI